MLSVETTGPMNASCEGGVHPCPYNDGSDHSCEVCFGENTGVYFSHDGRRYGMTSPGWYGLKYGCSLTWIQFPCEQSARDFTTIQCSAVIVVNGDFVRARWVRGKMYRWDRATQQYLPYTLKGGDYLVNRHE